MQGRLVPAAVVLVLLMLPLVALGGIWSTSLGRTVQDLGHLPLFAVITGVLLWLFSGRLLPALIGALLLAVATEGVQLFGPRDADLGDLARNVAGTIVALSLWKSWTIERSWRRWLLRLIAFALVATASLPLIRALDAYRAREQRLPVLFSFADDREHRFMHVRSGWYAFGERAECWEGGDSDAALQLSFASPVGSALVLGEPYPDWSDYNVIDLEFCSSNEAPIVLGLRIDDQHRSVRYTDRYNRHLTIEPGVTRLRISLDEIMRGPAERDLDLTRIDRIVIFPIDPTGGVGVWLAPLELRQIEFVRR